MEREKAELEVKMPDGSIATVVERDGDTWIVEKADGSRVRMYPPGHSDREQAGATIERELGS